jgi:cytochrome c5
MVAAGLFVLELGVAAAQTAPAASVPGPSPVLGPLPNKPGAETVQKVCSVCHVAENVLGKRLDRAGWDDLVQTMVDRGAVGSDAELKTVTDYLAANLGPDNPLPATPAPAPANPLAGNR